MSRTGSATTRARSRRARIASNGRSASTRTFAGSGPSARARSAVVTISNDALGQSRGDREEELEVAVRIRADRDDVHLRRPHGRRERSRVDAEGHELHSRRAPVLGEEALELGRLVLAVRHDRRRRPERGRVQPPHARAAQPHESLRQPDGDVDERPTEQPTPPREHERDADRVHRREDDVGSVRVAQRPEHGREVAAVASGGLEPALDRTAGDARPGGGSAPLQVVRRFPPPLPQLVEAEERVPHRGPRRRAQGFPAQRGVPEAEEDGCHRCRR